MKPSIVFVHGLWLHASSWNSWRKYFEEKGYKTYAPGWPGESLTIDETRAMPQRVAGYGINEVVDSYAEFIRSLPEKPIIIGHSFGGLIVQKLLGMNLGAAGVAIDAAPIKGVLALPFSALKVASIGISNPFNWSRSLSLTPEQFHYGFTNTLDAAESKMLYETYSAPSPMRPLFQAASANLVPNSSASVNLENSDRGPLLLIAGGMDHTVPASIVRTMKKMYQRSTANTEIKEFPDRDHSLCFNSKWIEIAGYVSSWIERIVVK